MTHVSRQGDVYFEKVVGKQYTFTSEKQVTVAYGEVSGHHHTIMPVDSATKIAMARDGEYILAKIEGGKAALFHGSDHEIAQVRNGADIDYAAVDIHAPQYLEEGVYRFWIQTEYDPQQYRRAVLD